MNVTMNAKSDSIDVSAPEGAYVGITVDGELVGAGTVSNGAASIKLSTTLAKGDAAKVVVTAKNHVPFFGTVEAN
jgi:hypothetical protein